MVLVLLLLSLLVFPSVVVTSLHGVRFLVVLFLGFFTGSYELLRWFSRVSVCVQFHIAAINDVDTSRDFAEPLAPTKEAQVWSYSWIRIGLFCFAERTQCKQRLRRCERAWNCMDSDRVCWNFNQESRLTQMYGEALSCLQDGQIEKAQSLFQSILQDPISIKAQVRSTGL